MVAARWLLVALVQPFCRSPLVTGFGISLPAERRALAGIQQQRPRPSSQSRHAGDLGGDSWALSGIDEIPNDPNELQVGYLLALCLGAWQEVCGDWIEKLVVDQAVAVELRERAATTLTHNSSNHHGCIVLSCRGGSFLDFLFFTNCI